MAPERIAEQRVTVQTHLTRQEAPLRRGVDLRARVDGAAMSLHGVMDGPGQDFRADVRAAIDPVSSMPDSAFKRQPGADVLSLVVNVPDPDPDRERTHQVTVLRHGPGDHELRTEGDSIRVTEQATETGQRVTVTLYKKDDAEPGQDPYTPLRIRTVRTRARRHVPAAEVRDVFRSTSGADMLPDDLVRDIRIAAERDAAAKKAAREQAGTAQPTQAA